MKPVIIKNIEEYIGDLRLKIEEENKIRYQLEIELKWFKREWDQRALEIKEINERCGDLLNYSKNAIPKVEHQIENLQ